MSDLASDVRSIQVKIEAAQRARIRAEQEYELAMTSFEQAKKSLQHEFGVQSSDAAKALLEKMESDVRRLIDRASEKLLSIEV